MQSAKAALRSLRNFWLKLENFDRAKEESNSRDPKSPVLQASKVLEQAAMVAAFQCGGLFVQMGWVTEEGEWTELGRSVFFEDGEEEPSVAPPEEAHQSL
jgi:hypothetical protein